MGIDENILNKPGRLTKEEFEEMKKHTLIGASMLKSLEPSPAAYGTTRVCPAWAGWPWRW